MKTKLKFLALCPLLSALCFTARAQTPAFTFQGQLTSGAGNANGSYDLRFAVYDANVAGNFIAGPITNAATTVSNGLFTVALNFGAVFTGTNYWVELGVRTNGGGSFATLVPRQSLTPAPYALYAPQASNALYALQAGNASYAAQAGNASQASNALALSPASAQYNSLCPPGSIMAYMGTTAPSGWLLCNGAYVSRTTYSNLFAVIGTSSGSGGGGSTTFRLPDTQGLFLRGRDAGIGRDPDAAARGAFDTGGNPGDAVGSYQGDEFKAHTHKTFTQSISGALTAGPNGSFVYNPGTGSDSGPASTSTSTETRPKNIYVNYIIKY